VETLSILLAPSGRPISAYAQGTIAFTSKLSGVPDITLSLTAPSGKQHIASVMDLLVFHPCVRLAHWRSKPGELSFVPPDGRFVLAGYEVDLLPGGVESLTPGSKAGKGLNLPVSVEVKTGLGVAGADFEVRLLLTPPQSVGSSSRNGAGGGGFGAAGAERKTSSLEGLTVIVPIPEGVRNITEIRPSRGDVTYAPAADQLIWQIPAKEADAGAATLRCTVVGNSDDEDAEDVDSFHKLSAFEEYDDTASYQSAPISNSATTQAANTNSERDEKKAARNKSLMPNAVRLSFGIKGWLASGIRVEGIIIDQKRSRGMGGGEGSKPYKGVKYLTVSRQGVEARC
jgi:hypothetical protein